MLIAPDFQKIKRLYHTAYDDGVPEGEADRAGERIDSLLPERLVDKLGELVIDDKIDSPEFEATFREFYRKPKLRRNALANAKPIKLAPEDAFRLYLPAPVVAINRQGTVKWVVDGRQHKAGDIINPRNSRGMLTVQFRYNGKPLERNVAYMLQTVGWIKPRQKKVKPDNEAIHATVRA
jgi:hypothetical protein